MTEILTESFCERCGTRYTFESTAPRRSRIGRVRTLSKGLRNFVLSDETTLSEAMADARSEEELAATATQLDAFHKTFNFCMSCRQYTCSTCWNEIEGRCLTCAPHLGHEILPAPFPQPAMPEPSNGHVAALDDESPEDATMWPEADLDPDRLARVMGTAPVVQAQADWPAADDLAADAVAEELLPEAPVTADAAEEEPAPDAVLGTASAALDEPQLAADDAVAAASPAELEPAVAATHEPAPDEETVPHAGLAAAALAAAVVAGPDERTAPAPIRGLEPGQSLDDAIAAYEASLDAEAPPAPAEPEVIAAEPEVIAAQAEVAADAEPEPEPVAAAAEPEPAPLDDVVSQPVWPAPTAASDTGIPTPAVVPPASPASPWLAIAPETPAATTGAAEPQSPATPDAAEPQWPATPQWPAAQPWSTPRTGRPEAPRTLAGRPLLPTEPSGLWAASSAEVLGQPGGAQAAAPSAQPCVSCGLSLSANARFCRRCGTRQQG